MPNFKLCYCEEPILSVCEHIFTSTINWDTMTRSIYIWQACFFTIKWFRTYWQVTGSKRRPLIPSTVYPIVWFFVWKVSLLRQVEQKWIFISKTRLFVFIRRWPLSVGVAANAFSCVFYFEQGDCGVLTVRSSVEGTWSHPMKNPAVKRLSNYTIVAQQFQQEQFFFNLRCTSWIL